MLRCLVVLLALVLLLGGCAQNTTEPPTPTQSIPVQTPTPTGIYIPGSAIEKATEGAVRAFWLDGGNYEACAQLGSDLLMMRTDGEDCVFRLCRGDVLEPIREFRLVKSAVPGADKLQINERGFGYFDSDSRSLIFINYELALLGQVELPEAAQGNAWLTPDWKNVYYCTQQGIFVMDLQTGISRLLREQTAARQEITGGFGNGEVIRCTMELENGEKQTLLIDAKTGAQLQSGTYLDVLITAGEQYFLPYYDRGVEMLRFGDAKTHQMLWPAEDDAQMQMLFANNAILAVQQGRDKTDLAYYDLQTGQRMAAITLEGICRVWGIQGDGKGGVWLYAGNATEGRWLYHWNCEKNLTQDETVYTAPYYTAEEPDEDGLARVNQMAKEIGDKFGVDILIWESAAAMMPENYVFTAEHITQLYEYYLPKLEQTLSIFHTRIFERASTQRLQLALVRSITGDLNLGTLPTRQSMQFWNKDIPFVVVTLDENFEYELLRSFYLYMETRLLSKSQILYEWYRQNPAEFFYDEDYVDNYFRTDISLTEGENPYFIDKFSMSFAREDRATVFATACMADGGDRFKTPVLQEKLSRICKAIREAYGLKKVTTEFIWEQYKA